MDCQTARKWMSPYLDSELETAKTFEIGEHLRVCESCRRRFDAERHVDDMLRDRLSRESMPPALWHQLRREVNRSELLSGFRIPAVIATAAGIMLFAVLYMASGDRGAKPSEVFTGQWAHYVNQAVPSESMLSDAEIEKALLDDYGLRFSTDREDTHRHPVKVIGGRHILFGSQPALELRVKCCGKVAVITTMLRSNADKLPPLIRELEKAAYGKDVKRDGVNIHVNTVGAAEFFIASEHYLDGLKDAIQPGKA